MTSLVFPNRRFHWYQPRAYLRQRDREQPAFSKVGAVFVIGTILSIMLALGIRPESLMEFVYVPVGAFALTSLLIFVAIPLAKRLPKEVLITDLGILTTSGMLPLAQIQHASIEIKRVGDQDIPVIVFKVKTGYEIRYGLSPEIDPKALTDFFASVGVRKPHP